MNGFLLHTNVVSELTMDATDARVLDFLAAHRDLWRSVIVLYELDVGIGLLPPGRRRDGISAAVTMLVSEYEDRILRVDRQAARQAADLKAQAQRSGHILDLGDALIAGTAMANDLSLATRNVRDFEGLGLNVIDPWVAP